MKPERAAYLVAQEAMTDQLGQMGDSLDDALWNIVPGFQNWPQSRRNVFIDAVYEVIYNSASWHPYESPACFHGKHEECGRTTDSHGDVWKVPPVCPECQAECVCECHEEAPLG